MKRRNISERWKFSKVGAASAVAAGVIVGSAAVAAAGPPANTSSQAGKITLCRATGSFKNPYVAITVNANSTEAVPKGHQGPVFDGVSKVWGDIIPPNPMGLKEGYNWSDQGRAMMSGKCGVPIPTTAAPTTAAPATSTTAAPTSTTAAPTTTSTTAAPATTSTTTMSYVWQQ